MPFSDPHVRLSLAGLTTLPPDVAKALSAFSGEELRLRGLPKLESASARALAGIQSRFSVCGLTGLDPDTAKVLTDLKLPREWFRGGDGGEKRSFRRPAWDGRLPHVSTLDPATAKELAHFPEEIHLTGLREMSPETASAIATVNIWGGYLPNITALDSPDSVAIAKALATHKGPLSLPNLEKISPKTLAALLEKEDVEIPLIETLELIPEPDGSATEDVVIPEGAQERQRRQATERR